MVFSSNLFLFGFLPCFLLAYYLAQPKLRNLLLFVASLGFYFWGAGWIVLLLFTGLVINYHLGRLVIGRRWLLVLGIGLNLSYLFYFKYFGFFRTEMGAFGYRLRLAFRADREDPLADRHQFLRVPGH